METSERAYRSALRSLARREHSRRELREKIRAKFGDFPTLERMLDRLENEGLQSDRRFAEAFVHAKGRRLGPGRLRFELRMKGVDDRIVQACIGKLSGEEQELASALECLRRKFPPGSSGADDRPRQNRFLHGRGFNAWVARRAVEEHAGKGAR